jgi:hypothetical protein
VSNLRVQKACVWSGVACMVLTGIGIVVFARFVPPPSPNETAQQTYDLFLHHHNRIRIGSLLIMLATPLWLPFVVVITQQMKRAEPGFAPIAMTQLVSGAMGTLIFVWPTIWWQVAAFRPQGRSPELEQTLNDVAWLPFVGVAAFAMVENFAIAIGSLRDVCEQPVYPRWVGYTNIWTALLLIPACMDVFFTTGPFAWNGAFAFWLAFAVFGIWFGVMVITTLKAIDREAAEA